MYILLKIVTEKIRNITIPEDLPDMLPLDETVKKQIH